MQFFCSCGVRHMSSGLLMSTGVHRVHVRFFQDYLGQIFPANQGDTIAMKRQHLLYFILVQLLAIVLWNGVIALTAQSPLEGFKQLEGVTYSPFRDGHNPVTGQYPTAIEIDEDIKLLAPLTKSIRTYGSSEPGVREIPAIANKYGLKVVPGAWLDANLITNQIEIDALVAAANDNDNVTGVVVGNEALFRRELTVSQLVSYVTQVKARVDVPVSVAETYGEWITNPAAMKPLADTADFISVHMLPYWEGVPIEQAVEHVQRCYQNMQRLYPGKRIVIAEVGWPSQGEYFAGSVPSAWNQETMVRRFMEYAGKDHPEYFVIEAFDQPWKTGEGDVGKYWGLFTADRHAKFDWQSPSYAGMSLRAQSSVAIILGALVLGLLMWRKRDLLPEGVLVAGLICQSLAAILVYYMALVTMPWLSQWGKMAWLVLLPGQMLILTIAVLQSYEMVELLWQRKLRREFEPLRFSTRSNWPKVSLHVACCNEPPAMVIRLLESLAALDYPNFEVLLLDNNTKDPQLWLPLQRRCEELGERFRFFHLENWPGFKAGALNHGLEQMASDVEYFGVIDADYVVRPDWLRATIPYFENPSVGFVQAPQDNRQWNRDFFKEMINWEYAGFFNLGMVHRNERDAIIQHGTMVLISKAAMQKVGKWAQWCICEDAELGMRLMANDYQAVYVNECFGQGLVPDSFMAYKKQRWRWVFGAMQIMRGHKTTLTRAKGGLTLAQRYHFLAGWLPWVGDALHLVCTLSMILWTIGLIALPRYVAVPTAAFVVPAILIGLFNIGRSLWLYHSRVPCSLGQRLAACCSGMALTYTISRACITGMFVKSRPFQRTPKCEKMSALSQCLMDVRDEVALGLMLWLGVLGVLLYRPWHNVASYAWMTAMIFQSLPYLAALGCSLVSGMPTVKFALDWISERRAAGAAARRANGMGVSSVMLDTGDE